MPLLTGEYVVNNISCGIRKKTEVDWEIKRQMERLWEKEDSEPQSEWFWDLNAFPFNQEYAGNAVYSNK